MIDSNDASTFGTGDFERALAYAARANAGHMRKGTHVPYLSHLLAVVRFAWDIETPAGGENANTIPSMVA